MNLELDEDETAPLVRLLRNAIDGDRYPLPPRVVELKGILGKLEARATP